MSELRVVSIQVRNVLGARELALKPGGKWTLLAGENGSGKSTAISAVQAALGGGNLAKLAHVPTVDEVVAARGKPDAFEAEVVLVLEGAGNEAYRVHRRGDKVRVLARVGDTAAFEDVGKPQTWLRSLYDATAANPVTFLNAKDADRARLLLEALDLKYDRAVLLQAMGVGTGDLPFIPEGLHPLEEIGLIRDAVFRTRTGINRDKDGKAAAAEEVRRSAPAVVPTDPGEAEEAAAAAELATLSDQIARREEQLGAAYGRADYEARHTYEFKAEELRTTFKREAARLRAEHARVAAEVRAEAERRIATAAAKVEEHVESLREAGETALSAVELDRDEAIGVAALAREQERAALQEVASAREAAAERLTNIRAQRTVASAALALHEQAKRFDADAERLKVESERLTLAITNLDAFARTLASNLPIEGLEITGKEIRVHGVPYEQLNHAQRVDIAVRVACLRAKDQRLPVVFVDGAESLDKRHFDLLVARLEEEGVQAFLGRVDNDAFRVETDEGVRA